MRDFKFSRKLLLKMYIKHFSKKAFLIPFLLLAVICLSIRNLLILEFSCLIPNHNDNRCSASGTFLPMLTNESLSLAVSTQQGKLLTAHDIPRLSNPCLPRLISENDREETFKLMAYIMRLFYDYDIQFFIHRGVVLGSYLFHDIQPWDDDVDIGIRFKDINKLRALLRNESVAELLGVAPYLRLEPVNTFRMPYLRHDVPADDPHSCLNPAMPKARCFHYLQVFFKNSSSTLKKPELKYPYVDIVVVNENSTHVWYMNQDDLPYVYLKEDFLPFHMRPVGPLWCPTPRKSYQWLAGYSKSRCATTWYRHKTQMFAPRQSIPCDSVKYCYPVVSRRYPYKDVAGQDWCIEDLTLRGKLVQQVKLKFNCEDQETRNFLV